MDRVVVHKNGSQRHEMTAVKYNLTAIGKRIGESVGIHVNDESRDLFSLTPSHNFRFRLRHHHNHVSNRTIRAPQLYPIDDVMLTILSAPARLGLL